MVIAINLDIPQSPLFPLLDYSSSSPSSSSGHSGHQALSSADIVSLLLSRPPRQFSTNSSYTRAKLQGDLNKPLPDIPNVNIPPQAIISLLDLLDKLDADVEEQVSRAKENIEDVRQLVDICRQERSSRQERARKARDAIKRETKEIGCDFWLGV